MHDEDTSAVLIEQIGTEFRLSAFRHPQRVTFTHRSTTPLRFLPVATNGVTFVHPAEVVRRARTHRSTGVIAWLLISALIWRLSRSPRPADRPKVSPGMHTWA